MSCDHSVAESTCNRRQCSDTDSPYCLATPLGSFTCPARPQTCDGIIHSDAAWGTQSDTQRIRGDIDTTLIPFETKAVRRSWLDPCELIPAYDEIWSDGICLEDAWEWRPHIDTVVTLLGMQHLFKVYVLELGGPPGNYERIECDLASFTNDTSSSAYWRHEVQRAKQGNDVQIIDVPGQFCTANKSTAAEQYQHPSGTCQHYEGAIYSVGHYNSDGIGFHSGRYIFTPDKSGQSLNFSEFVHCHEMIHLFQNAHTGRRLYMEHPDDGESSTLWFEYISYVTYTGYISRQKDRFGDLTLTPAWHGWRIDDDLRNSQYDYPSWMDVTFPSFDDPDALNQKWFAAVLIQSTYRLYLAIQPNGTYENHAFNHLSCQDDFTICDPTVVFNSLNELQKKHYEHEPYQIVFDWTYRLKNLQTLYFVHKAKQNLGTFGVYEFWTYELTNKRFPFEAGASESDAEMFGLAGFSGRVAFLTNFHEWIVQNIQNQVPPLTLALTITPDHSELLQDIERLKTKHRTEGINIPRCNDMLAPFPKDQLQNPVNFLTPFPKDQLQNPVNFLKQLGKTITSLFKDEKQKTIVAVIITVVVIVIIFNQLTKTQRRDM